MRGKNADVERLSSSLCGALRPSGRTGKRNVPSASQDKVAIPADRQNRVNILRISGGSSLETLPTFDAKETENSTDVDDEIEILHCFSQRGTQPGSVAPVFGATNKKNPVETFLEYVPPGCRLSDVIKTMPLSFYKRTSNDVRDILIQSERHSQSTAVSRRNIVGDKPVELWSRGSKQSPRLTAKGVAAWVAEIRSPHCVFACFNVEYEWASCLLIAGLLCARDHTSQCICPTNSGGISSCELCRAIRRVLPEDIRNENGLNLTALPESFWMRIPEQGEIAIDSIEEKIIKVSKFAVRKTAPAVSGIQSTYIRAVCAYVNSRRSEVLDLFDTTKLETAGTESISSQDQHLTRSLLWCLRPSGLSKLKGILNGRNPDDNRASSEQAPNDLNADIINAWFRLLQAQNDAHFSLNNTVEAKSDKPRVLFLSTDYITALCAAEPRDEVDRTLEPDGSPSKKRKIRSGNEKLGNLLVCLSGLRRIDTYLEKRGIHFWDYDRILLPVHSLGAHWTLIEIDVGKKEVRYFDPLRRAFTAAAKQRCSAFGPESYFVPLANPLGAPLRLVARDSQLPEVPQDLDMDPALIQTTWIDNTAMRRLPHSVVSYLMKASGWFLFEYVASLLLHLAEKHGRSEYADISLWRRVVVEGWTPQHDSSHDCGVVICQYARCIGEGLSKPDFATRDAQILRCLMVRFWRHSAERRQPMGWRERK